MTMTITNRSCSTLSSYYSFLFLLFVFQEKTRPQERTETEAGDGSHGHGGRRGGVRGGGEPRRRRPRRRRTKERSMRPRRRPGTIKENKLRQARTMYSALVFVLRILHLLPLPCAFAEDKEAGSRGEDEAGGGGRGGDGQRGGARGGIGLSQWSWPHAAKTAQTKASTEKDVNKRPPTHR